MPHGHIPAIRPINMLNDALELDRDAITQLLKVRIPCNKALADHPNIIVREDKDGNTTVGVLGVINAILEVVMHEPIAPIAVVYNDNDHGLDEPIKFCSVPPKED